LIAAVREALGPFKEELKTEIQSELLEPMETRLGSKMGEMEARLQGEITNLGERLNQLAAETHGLTNDVVGPFIDMVTTQHRALVKRLDHLERRIERILSQLNMQERRLLSISDEMIAIQQHLNTLEQRLSGEITYDIAHAELVLAEERSVFEMIRGLEERVARLETRSKGAKETK
jgi:flagellar biosynthesis/type III secretory pathway chaperone